MDNQETNQTTGRFHIGQEIYVMTSVSHDRNYVYPTKENPNTIMPTLFKTYGLL